MIIAVGDQAGRLLWIEGDDQLRTLTDDMGFVAGANWSEDAVGTSAPGTALALGQSVQIRGAEHYNRLVHPWSCTACTGCATRRRSGCWGVIDITGGPDVVSPQARLLVDATARAVESELMVARLRERSEAPRNRPTTSKPRTPVTAPGDAACARTGPRAAGDGVGARRIDDRNSARGTPPSC